MEPGGTWLLQNRAHAHFNNVYMVCPNVGPVYVHPQMEHPYDIAGGNSHIVDYQGNVLGHTASRREHASSPASSTSRRCASSAIMNLNSNWMKDLRTEMFRRMYERADPPDEPLARAGPAAARRGRRGLPRATSSGWSSAGQLHAAGARLSRAPGTSRPAGIPDEADWENVRGLWAPPAER